MRLVNYAAVAALAALATPAKADETRVEVRSGIVWCCGVSDETIGLAVGHDFDLGGDMFAGIEAVADTDFDFVDPTIGVNARLGTKLGEDTKVFVLGGYAYETGFDFDDALIGAGVQHNVGEKALLSLQYQRYLDTDVNRVAVGFGLRF